MKQACRRLAKLVTAQLLAPLMLDHRRSDALLSAENPLGDSPPWLKYVPPLLPFTLDLHLGVTAPGAVYESEPWDS